MEPHTEALEVVCRHFKTEFGDKAFARMKTAKLKAQKENYRLRKRVRELERSLGFCRELIEIQACSIEMASRGRKVMQKVIEEYF